jgi:hypothetical protein
MGESPVHGIIIVPRGQVKVEEGQSLDAGIPPTLDLDLAADQIKRPMLATCGIVRSPEPDRHPAFRFVAGRFLLPELERRRARLNKRLLAVIRSALVILPAEDPTQARVLLNQEVEVRSQDRATTGGVLLGEGFRPENTYDLAGLELDGLQAGRDGFFWVVPEPGGHALYFNLLPLLDHRLPEEQEAELHRAILDTMAQEYLRAFFRRGFDADAEVRQRLAQEGWVPSPLLLPDPWLEMVDSFTRGEPDVTDLAAAAFPSERAEAVLDLWCRDQPFTADRPFLERGIERYFAGDYISAVSVMLPRIEGIMNAVRRDAGLRAENSVRQALTTLDSLSSGPLKGRWLRSEVLQHFESFVHAFLDSGPSARAKGPLLKRGRHGHAHGATSAAAYDQRYALQAILAIDALHFILRR